jgi:hypothetical protein
MKHHASLMKISSILQFVCSKKCFLFSFNLKLQSRPEISSHSNWISGLNIQCSSLVQRKSDNNNRMIQLTDVFCALLLE